MSNADRLFDDGDLPLQHAVSHRGWAHTNETRTSDPRMDDGRLPPSRELPRLAAPASPAYAAPLRPAQRACYEALSLALQEGHVFAAVTGPAASGKTMVLDSVLADRQNRALRCIRISDPDKVPARLAAQIEEVAYAEAGKPENLERHVVLAVDDAHTASDELLRCLARLAAMREPGRRVPQVLLVGRPELWQRLSIEELSPLARRIAIRAVLPPLEDEIDPWASLEQEVSQTMSSIRAESALAASPMSFRDPLFDRAYTSGAPATTERGGLPLSDEPVPPPMEYALFPDPPPRQSASARRESRVRMILPLGCLMVGVAVFGFVLSYYDWPDVLGGLPWSAKPAEESAPFVFSPQGSSHGLPRPPGWSQSPPKHAIAGSPNPYAPTPAVKPATASNDRPGAAPADPTSAPVAATLSIAAPPIRPPPTSPLRTATLEPPHIDILATAPVTSSPPSASPPLAPPPLAAPPSPPPPTPATAASATPDTRGATPAAIPIVAHPAPIAPPPVVRAAPLSAPVVALLLRRGDEQSAIGDVFAARLLFERAAEAGSALGALRLARTYDAAFVSPADAATLVDPAAAKRWYTRAVALGDRDAAARLKAIGEGR